MRKQAGPFIDEHSESAALSERSGLLCGPQFCHYDPFAEHEHRFNQDEPDLKGHNGRVGRLSRRGSQYRSSGGRPSGAVVARQAQSLIRRNAGNVVALFDAPHQISGERIPRPDPTEDPVGAGSVFPEQPLRRYDCENYNTCLGLAAALDWNSFSCQGCCGNVNQKLLWRAHCAVRQNKALQKLCALPPVNRPR